LHQASGDSDVLAFADADDVGVARLVAALANRLPVTWWQFGLAEQSISVELDENGFRLEQARASVSSADIQRAPVLVYRRRLLQPRPLVRSSLPAPADRAFSEREWGSLIDALLLAEEKRCGATWLNSPSATTLTSNKLALLLFAVRAGLPVPRFSVSTPVRLPSSISGNLVTKAISADEQIDAGRYFSTALLSPLDLESLEGLDVPTPSLLQEYVPPSSELRVFYILGRFLSLALTPSPDHVDIRYVQPERLLPRVCEIPSGLRDGLDSLARGLGLRYCTFDLLVSTDGSPMLIDITPNGGWDHFESAAAPVVTEFLAEAIVDQVRGSSKSGADATD
jgi:glutathione synthase/RimK-type ligase-like ATP-grasp enzyme